MHQGCKAAFKHPTTVCSLGISVADPGCLSRIPDPDFYPSRISDPGSKNSKKEGWKKICCHTFFCSHKFHIIENYFIFEMMKKKIWANFQRIIEVFTQKIVTKLSKLWVWDPEKTYSGSRIQGSKKHRIRIRNTVSRMSTRLYLNDWLTSAFSYCAGFPNAWSLRNGRPSWPSCA